MKLNQAYEEWYHRMAEQKIRRHKRMFLRALKSMAGHTAVRGVCITHIKEIEKLRAHNNRKDPSNNVG